MVKSNYKKNWREFVSTAESSINKLVSLVREETQDKALLNAYSKHSLNKEFSNRCINGWHPLKKGLSLAQINPISFYTTIKDKASSVELMKWSREVVGLPIDRISSEEIFKKQMFYFDFEIPESVLYTTNKDLSKLESSFKKNVITSMYALYYSYAYKKIPWIVLEISSSYRDTAGQARVMVDSILVKDRYNMVQIYPKAHYFALQLITDLYYDGNHLGCQDGCMHNKGQIVCGYFISQRGLYNNTTLGKSAFDIYLNDTSTNLQKNTDKIKVLLESWITKSGYKSNHQNNKALDFSARNKTQFEEFNKILREYGISKNWVYEDSKSSHISQ